jgi:DNA recombination protein RmuC
MLLWIGIGLAVGLVLGFLLGRAVAGARTTAERTRAHALDAELAEAKTALASALLEKQAAETARAILQGRMDAMEEARNSIKETFDSLAAQALQKNNESFLTLAQQELNKQQDAAKITLESKEEAIQKLLTPVSQALDKLETATKDLEVKREGAYQAVLGAVTQVEKMGDKLNAGTRQLNEALRRPQVRGNWGQEQLERCIEYAGMVEHVSFETEVVTSEGLRPDCIVQLPNHRTIVIDVKTPMEALMNAANCTEEAERALWLSTHARNVRNHLKDLSSKAYGRQFEESPDFVVCFLPSEASFSAALEQDAGLIEYGSQQNVILATPTTLIALLKAVAYGWQQMEVTRNAIAIQEAAKKLYDKLATARNYFDDLGKALKRSIASYNSLVGCVEGRDSIFDQARKMHELGIGQEEVPETPPVVEPTPRELKSDDWQPDNQIELELAAASEDANRPK